MNKPFEQAKLSEKSLIEHDTKQRSYSSYKFFKSKNSEENNNLVNKARSDKEKTDSIQSKSLSDLETGSLRESDYVTISEGISPFSLMLKDISDNSSFEILRDNSECYERAAQKNLLYSPRVNYEEIGTSTKENKCATTPNVKNNVKNVNGVKETPIVPKLLKSRSKKIENKYKPLDIVEESPRLVKIGLSGYSKEVSKSPQCKAPNIDRPLASVRDSILTAISSSSIVSFDSQKKTSTPVNHYDYKKGKNKEIESQNMNFQVSDISTIKKPSSPTKVVRKEKPFLDKFKRECPKEDIGVSHHPLQRHKHLETELFRAKNSLIVSPKLKLSIQTTDSTLSPNPRNCKENAVSSDEDIVLVNENGEKINQPVVDKHYGLRKKLESPDAQLILCEYNNHVITAHDYKTLEDGEYLNDSVIDFYLSFLHTDVLSNSMKEVIHIYSSHFYSRLKGSPCTSNVDLKSSGKTRAEMAYLRVKSWTRKINIFSKRMLIFPICEDEHWYMIIVCNPGLIKTQHDENKDSRFPAERSKDEIPCMIVLDSLGSPHSNAVKRIRSYLEYEYLTREKTFLPFQKDKMMLNCPVVPLQPNSCDCGVYLLHYAQLIFKKPSVVLENCLPNLSQWFEQEDMDNKRREIAKTIQLLAAAKEEPIDEAAFPSIKFSGVEAKWRNRKKKQSCFNSEDNHCLSFKSSTNTISMQSKEKPALSFSSSDFEDSNQLNSSWGDEKVKISKTNVEEFEVKKIERKVYIKTEKTEKYRIPKKVNSFQDKYEETFRSLKSERSNIAPTKTVESSGYDTSDNNRYFKKIKSPGLINRIGIAFGSNASKINDSSNYDKLPKRTKLALNKIHNKSPRDELPENGFGHKKFLLASSVHADKYHDVENKE